MATFVGIVLITSAFFKSTDLESTQSFASEMTIPARILVINIEGFTGTLLLLRWFRVTCWLAVVLLFTIFCTITFILGLMGQQDCGCFGKIHANPWLIFVLDSMCMVALVLGRPHCSYDTLQQSLKITGYTSILALIAFAISNTPTAEEWWVNRKKYKIQLTPYICDLGKGSQGEQQVISLIVINHTGEPIKIVGGKFSCDCIANDNLPTIIPPYGNQKIPLVFTFKGSPGAFIRKYELFTDDAECPKLHGRIKGIIVEYP